MSTARLTLVAGTVEMARAEMRDRTALAALLDAQAPDDWPPPLNDENSLAWFLRKLEEDQTAVGWVTWYFLLRAGPAERVPHLIGNGGFFGRPTSDGTVELGYSILPEHQRHGYASEAVDALVRWAFSTPEVLRVTAHTLPDLTPSIRVLEKCGFRLLGPGAEEGTIQFERRRDT